MDFATCIANATKVEENCRPWPMAGQLFDVFIAVIGEDEDTEAHILSMTAPRELDEVLHEYDGTKMTGELFDEADIPTAIGLYKATLEFVETQGWVEGFPDPSQVEYSFNVVQIAPVPQSQNAAQSQ